MESWYHSWEMYIIYYILASALYEPSWNSSNVIGITLKDKGNNDHYGTTTIHHEAWSSCISRRSLLTRLSRPYKIYRTIYIYIWIYECIKLQFDWSKSIFQFYFWCWMIFGSSVPSTDKKLFLVIPHTHLFHALFILFIPLSDDNSYNFRKYMCISLVYIHVHIYVHNIWSDLWQLHN